jgi:hypothetical protein
MNRKLWYTPLLLTVFAFVANNAQSELHDRGGGLIYDDVLDVTWLQDANYPKTLGLSADGRLRWEDAKQWVATLEYFDSVRNVTWTGWRLPRAVPLNGVEYNDTFSVDGTTDNGYNIVSPNSELSYMYYVNLGNVGYADAFGNWPLPNYGLVNKGPFVNLNPMVFPYWYGNEFPIFPGMAWVFVPLTGSQHEGVKDHEFFVWPVRDGDVAGGQGTQ